MSKNPNFFENPLVIERSSDGDRAYDLASIFFKERKIFLYDEVDGETSRSIISQLLYLDEVHEGEEIVLYINSPGGSVPDGLAIIDAMEYIKSPVRTFCVGMAASMAMVILAAGENGKRQSFPNSRMMMHQPMGGTFGQYSDIELYTEEMKKIKDILYGIISEKTGMSLDQVKIDGNRDFWLSPEEALEYGGLGVIDEIIKKKA